ncbi:hypothetical protein ACJX0J_034382, partial [Zea mays]
MHIIYISLVPIKHNCYMENANDVCDIQALYRHANNVKLSYSMEKLGLHFIITKIPHHARDLIMHVCLHILSTRTTGGVTKTPSESLVFYSTNLNLIYRHHVMGIYRHHVMGCPITTSFVLTPCKVALSTSNKNKLGVAMGMQQAKNYYKSIDIYYFHACFTCLFTYLDGLIGSIIYFSLFLLYLLENIKEKDTSSHLLDGDILFANIITHATIR